MTGAADIFLYDVGGTVIAGRTDDGGPPGIGAELSALPFFHAALEGRLGRFFALGTTSNKRGYYFAYPVRRGGEVVGALAVKVDVEEMERVWHRQADHVLVLDDTRMVFMSDRQDWLYGPLGALSDGERARLSETRRYDRVDRPPLPVQEAAPATAAPVVTLGREAADRFMRLEAEMPDAGWTVVMLAGTAAADSRIVAFTLIAAVALLALAGAWWASVQRRRAMREKLETEERTRVALERAAADLERRVEERTAALAAARDELVQAEKMAALGQMLTGLGHELNQPITAIRSYADNTLKLLAAGRMQAVQDNLHTIADVTERANRLIRHLKSFARKGRLTLGTTPLVGVVQSALQLVAHQARDSGVSIRVGSGISGTAVNADPVRLEQVFVNLLTNALDAVAGARERWIVIDAVATGSAVEITVADSGPGIPAETRDRIFEPMYTTKEPGSGLGRGLTIVQGAGSRLRTTIDDGWVELGGRSVNDPSITV